MSDRIPEVPSTEPLTRRQKEDHLRKNCTPKHGESEEEYATRLNGRLDTLRQDLDFKENHGTLRLMDAQGHRDRADELIADADGEMNSEYKIVLLRAPGVHHHHARVLDAEAQDYECEQGMREAMV